ncbi:hypothetical protein P4310_24760 [Bacillus thuringiensis]|uniref:hypothetical protein n=1 Tax=Bacillus cereus group TaxID=86661 RepID=UPI000A3CA39D|nr:MULTISPECIES: hypothetical protein [Bacillus cereus group]MCU5121291.1 hypothetical protein [Bacillus cereus]MED3068673.1 hypothetical protein [Bacillus thuringiensis]OUB30467.1 hypothetical protein BK737_17465 [Bacillus thuringiensis serovar palmanyolensis]PFF36781.1 hypothetical protein CN328_26145 [Bacillus cereus]
MDNGIVGHWCQDKNIKLVKIGEDVFALHGWDGDSYNDSWKCTGDLYMNASKERYDITPRYLRVSADITLMNYQVEEK